MTRALNAVRGKRWSRAARIIALTVVCLGVVLCAWSAMVRVETEPSVGIESSRLAPVARAASEDGRDDALQQAADAALGAREGTIILLDAQTGRLRAVANSRVAFEEATAPGSTIKAFTLLAGLRAGLLNAGSRVQCRERYERGDFKIACSHPRFKPAFDPAQALGYSCNYFFAKLGEQLDTETFTETLASFGFGAPAGGGDANETAGALPRGRWQVRYALGESESLRVTPAQLITAYTALVNGGHLYVPQRALSENFIPRERARLDIADAHRELILKGMRGAITYGTAARSGLSTLEHYVFGKTGTSTPGGGDAHSQGWFVGFAAEKRAAGGGDENAAGSDDERVPSPASVKLAVLIHLKHAHGSECAEVSQAIFDAYERAETSRVDAVQSPRRDLAPSSISEGNANEEARASVDENHAGELAGTSVTVGSAEVAQPAEAVESPVENSNKVEPDAGAQIRVRLSREGRTLRLSLDDYVYGVLAAEGSVENELEALKAQAVVSRTYALKNLRRHAREGYDLCTSTHCQRFLLVRDVSVRPGFYELVRRAVNETRREVLRDRQGRVAEGYFSASCGGETADIGSLWGVQNAPPQLRGVRDDFCTGDKYHSWTDVIPSARLVEALHIDTRSDVGARLDSVRVVRRDRTGRAELVALEGERRKVLRGWDFKIIVGRTLGWSILKSSRFEVARAGTNFIFRGSGFGHGLGLCQSGAHVMARRGASYRQILNQYLPGTTLGGS